MKPSSPSPTEHLSHEENHLLRNRAAKLAVFAASFLTILKLSVGWYTHSIGLVSDGVHSLFDLMAAAVAFFTVRAAHKPADREHPYGHGKIETLSSFFEAVLLLGAGSLIAYESIKRLFHPQEVIHQSAAIITVLISVGLSWIVYRHNKVAAEKTESSALKVNAFHFYTDFISSIGLLAGLILLHFTGWTPIDALMGLGVSVIILKESYSLIKAAVFELVDAQLPEDEVKIIKDALKKFESRMIDIHDLKTRRSGAIRHIDFHLVTCGVLTVNDSHKLCDEIEKKIYESFPKAMIHIHVEPCSHASLNCKTACDFEELQKDRSLIRLAPHPEDYPK